MPNCWWHDHGCQHLAGDVACASSEASPASSVRRSSAGSARLGRATRWRRVHDGRATQWRRVARHFLTTAHMLTFAPLGGAECTTIVPLSGVEWCAHAQRSSGAVEVDGTRRQHDGQGHLAYPREGASILPTAPPQPMILGRTGGHICYDGVAKRAIGSGVEHFLHTEGVAGSNPASPTRQVHEVSDSLTSFLRCE